jgi:hypothetical protein
MELPVTVPDIDPVSVSGPLASQLVSLYSYMPPMAVICPVKDVLVALITTTNCPASFAGHPLVAGPPQLQEPENVAENVVEVLGKDVVSDAAG